MRNDFAGVGFLKGGGLFQGGLINLQVLGYGKHNVLYIFCTLELLSPKGLTHIKHILNIENGEGPQNLIGIAKEYQVFFTRTD